MIGKLRDFLLPNIVRLKSLKNPIHTYCRARIEEEGLMERAIILCKLNKSLLESSISVGIHRQKVCMP